MTNGRAGDDKDPELSRDGSLLFYASSSYGEHLDLFVKRIGANTVTRLTTASGDERFPKVNPRAPRMLAFCSNDRGEWDIYVMEDYEADPGKVALISEPGTHDIHPSWSPDGLSLVYCSTEDFGSGTWVLKVWDSATRKTHVLEEVDGLLPEWSPVPKDNRIVFQRMKHRDGWYGSIWVLEYDLGIVRNVTSIFASDDWAAINPSWSPDARRVAFATVAKSRARAGILNEADDVWVVNADGSHPTRLTADPAADWMPAWAPDPERAEGRIYFVSKRTGTHRIWSLFPRLPDPNGAPAPEPRRETDASTF
jgi:TolB protein